MSSNIQVQRICQRCGNEFAARTTVTRYCSNRCNKAANKARERSQKIEVSNTETTRKRTQPIEVLKAKEFLNVQEVATLLNCSKRSVYHYLQCGTINGVNIGQRLTRVKRSELDKLFEQASVSNQGTAANPQPVQYEITDCYNLTEVQEKFGISETALQVLVKRFNVPKLKKGWYAYVPKAIIENLLKNPKA